mmetsp:Transcript_9478/g.33244  ORF Transcript_9478/g.33244 Transcript_9478/m.33244 type:complete len:212 (-) Transcript_9478:194-829(-)
MRRRPSAHPFQAPDRPQRSTRLRVRDAGDEEGSVWPDEETSRLWDSAGWHGGSRLVRKRQGARLHQEESRVRKVRSPKWLRAAAGVHLWRGGLLHGFEASVVPQTLSFHPLARRLRPPSLLGAALVGPAAARPASADQHRRRGAHRAAAHRRADGGRRGKVARGIHGHARPHLRGAQRTLRLRRPHARAPLSATAVSPAARRRSRSGLCLE